MLSCPVGYSGNSLTAQFLGRLWWTHPATRAYLILWAEKRLLRPPSPNGQEDSRSHLGTPRSFHTWMLYLLPSLRWNISRSWGPYFPIQPEGMHSTGDCLEAGQRDQQRKEKPPGGLSTGLRSERQLRVDILEERHTERPPCLRQNVSLAYYFKMEG